jgi:DNA-directed RNA polymerase specialized sigma subunit
MTLKEIAAILKVTESRVSQIHSKVLVRIGYKLKRAI